MIASRLLCIGLLAAPLTLTAQTPPPTRPTPAAAGQEQPAVRIAAPEDLRDEAGTTIVGERESPIGLYITPWRNAYAEQDIDRPARLLQVDLSALDRDVFAREIEYYDALTEAARAKRAPAAKPAVNPATP